MRNRSVKIGLAAVGVVGATVLTLLATDLYSQSKRWLGFGEPGRSSRAPAPPKPRPRPILRPQTYVDEVSRYPIWDKHPDVYPDARKAIRTYIASAWARDLRRRRTDFVSVSTAISSAPLYAARPVWIVGRSVSNYAVDRDGGDVLREVQIRDLRDSVWHEENELAYCRYWDRASTPTFRKNESLFVSGIVMMRGIVGLLPSGQSIGIYLWCDPPVSIRRVIPGVSRRGTPATVSGVEDALEKDAR